MIGTFWNLCRACPSMPIDKVSAQPVRLGRKLVPFVGDPVTLTLDVNRERGRKVVNQVHFLIWKIGVRGCWERLVEIDTRVEARRDLFLAFICAKFYISSENVDKSGSS